MNALEKAAQAVVSLWSARYKGLRDFDPADRIVVGQAIDALRAVLEQAEPVAESGEQPNALRIAAALDGTAITDITEALTDDAAGELRWLYAEYQRLKQAEPVTLNGPTPPFPIFGSATKQQAEQRQAEPVDAVLIEREACAQLCADYTEWGREWAQDSNHMAAEAAANECADAIRARGKR